jgi:hypothetical protein
MISVDFEDAQFFIEMANFVKYSEGYLEGIHLGKSKMLQQFGANTKEIALEYIDTMARVDPLSLHHVYEWYQTGSPEARLFDIDYRVTNGGLSFDSTFSQSKSFSRGSQTPFYDKASIMENGIPVTIRPKRSQVLAFEDNGETIFTKGPVEITNPGGSAVQGSFSETLKTFFGTYFTQAFLTSSGFTRYLETPMDYKTNLPKSKTGGASAGKQIGYNWIVKAGGKI